MGYPGVYTEQIKSYYLDKNENFYNQLNNVEDDFPLITFTNECAPDGYASFKHRVASAINILLIEHNILLIITRGYATDREQQKLYNEYLSGGVRAAPPNLSWHTLGLAVDCVPITPGGQADYNTQYWQTITTVFREHAIISGASYNDQNHFNDYSCLTITEFRNRFYPNGYKPKMINLASLTSWFLIAGLVGLFISEDFRKK
jgi:hypothetical protein